jgi:fatty acid desaturase
VDSSARAHDGVSARLVIMGLAGFVALGAALLAVQDTTSPGRMPLLALLIVAQGLWIYRLYLIAHEAAHSKLFPRSPWLNDALAVVLLAPLGAPLAVYRKVHHFHHGSNRKDDRHAALDHFHVAADAGPVTLAYKRAVWIFYVFLGGFFLHAVATIVIFLFVPTRFAARIDPAFARWRASDRARAWLQLLPALALHLGVALGLGSGAWKLVLGAPLLVFAWLSSLLLYVYHYGTSVGPDVRCNVRALPRQPLLSWLLLNFNEHVTHHADPGLPWYLLPARRVPLPARFSANQNVGSLWQAIWQQRRGPVMCVRPLVLPMAAQGKDEP